jgi:tetratricopeptide (TPR) repeat protein
MASDKKTKKPLKTGTNYLPSILIILFSFILYGNTLTFDYALDDAIVTSQNAFVKKGFSGIREIYSYDSFTGFFGTEKKLVEGGRYRPLSIATFAVEYGMFNGYSPGFSHFINILLYAISGMLIFLVFSRLFKPSGDKAFYISLPFIASLLFLGHPMHTEVVANIKGRDEILALLFSLLALWLVLLYLEKPRSLYILLANFAFFLGLLSKENTITFLAVIPLTLWFFKKPTSKQYLIIVLPLLVTAGVFILLRFLVLGYMSSGELPRELLNNPFLDATASRKFATIIYTLGLYIKLLFFPHPLTHDYYPYHIPLVSVTDWKALLSFMIYLALIVYAFMNLKKKSVISYGIIYFLVTISIVSNLVFPVGTFMNERFVYMPSLGFVLIIAWFFTVRWDSLWKAKNNRRIALYVILLVILSLYSVNTISRNFAWKDDFTLFSTDVKVSFNSTKCNTSAGGKYLDKVKTETDTAKRKEYLIKTIQYLDKGLEIYPENTNCLILKGNALAIGKNDLHGAIDQYMKIFTFNPGYKLAYTNILFVAGFIDDQKEADYKLHVYKQLYSIDPENAELNSRLGKIYGQVKGRLDSAEFFLVNAVRIDPGLADAYKDLGVLYGMKKDYPRAMENFQKALSLNPNDEQTRSNLDVTARLMQQGKQGK